MLERLRENVDNITKKVNLKQSKFFLLFKDFIGISVSKVDQSIKDLILELLEEADELVPIGSLDAFDSTKKTFGYFENI